MPPVYTTKDNNLSPPVAESRVDLLEDLLIDLSEKLLELHDSLLDDHYGAKYERKAILSLVDNIREVLGVEQA